MVSNEAAPAPFLVFHPFSPFPMSDRSAALVERIKEVVAQFCNIA